MTKLRNLLRENPYGYLLRTAWRYAGGMRARYVLIYAMYGAVNALVSLQPIIYGYYVNFLQAGEGDLLTGSLWYAAAYLGIILATWVFQWPARLAERRMAFDIGQRLLLETYDQIVHLPLAWHRERHSGDTINRARKAYEALKNFFDSGFVYFQTIARMTIALVAILFFSPVFGAVASVAGLLILGVVLAFDGPIIRANLETNERENDLLASLTDNLGNIITVTTLRLGERTARTIEDRIGNIWPPFLRNTRYNEGKWFTVGVLMGLMYGSLIVGYVWQNYTPGEAFLVGGLVTLIGYVTQFSGMLSSLTAQYNQVIRYRTDLAAIEPINQDYARRSRPTATGEVYREWSHLDVRNIQFQYGDEGAMLDNVSLNLDRGKRVALIGPSGSGKTTTLYTLRGLYPPDAIEVVFDGKVRDRDGGQLFDQTTLVPQSPEVFENTLRSNLTVGLERPAAELAKAIHVSVLDDVIAGLEEGLDTFLAEGGANLSGGQRQRINIARGLLAANTSTLLLMDEPTSSLDPQTELLVYERLFATYPDTTIVSTLHRLHLLRFFDYIYYLENGRVVAQGKLADLLDQAPGFRRLYDEQLGVGT